MMGVCVWGIRLAAPRRWDFKCRMFIYFCVCLALRGKYKYRCMYLSSSFVDCLLCFYPHCMFRLYVDGPFGSPSEEVFNYDVSVCVAGGIGVTPFACMLHALLWVMKKTNEHHILTNDEQFQQALACFFSFLPSSLLYTSDGWTGFRLQRLYFVWVCRELQSFYWFAELLCALHHKVRTQSVCYSLHVILIKTCGT